MKEPHWVLRETALALQERLLAEFGGLGGLRDEGLLESALARPQQLFAYGKPSLFDLAAAYAFGLVRNHPFLDGNKRIGFTTAVVFLELNGYRFAASEADATIKTLALAARELDEADYAAWLKANSPKA
ncbi:MAG: type II toxin-antitoxin system death-on-curing family toxin [Verrucomicrobia bacterium]|nr:type II toxin-antitoxin system death-on-curing family toxin [Verrucomicrobiota bacterium]